MRKRTRTIFLIVAFLLFYPALLAQTPPDSTKLRDKAFLLWEKNDLIGALPLLDKLASESPQDSLVLERLAFCLLARAATLTDLEERRQERLRARGLFIRVKELGQSSGDVQALIDMIPADGNIAPFSEQREAEAAMREGEAAFARSDFPGALSAYERACRLDPKLYDAPLFMGDVYFRMNQLTWASQWFEQAVKVDPDRETAYRYWGDALMAAGKMEEARAKFVDAIIAEPYQRLSWVGLKRWAQRQQVKLARLELQSPHSIKVGDGKPDITINVDPNALTRKDGTEFWVVYTVQRARWRKQEFSKAFPDEKTYRHSLREETDALGLLASTVAKEYSNPDKAKKLDPSLATLLKVKSEDLLEAYVLLSAVDEGIAKDYPAYRAIHRDKLRQYLNEYIIQPPQP